MPILTNIAVSYTHLDVYKRQAFESISHMLKALGHAATTRVLSMRVVQAGSDPHSACLLYTSRCV